MFVLLDQDYVIVYICIVVLLKFKLWYYKVNIKIIINYVFYICNICIVLNKMLLDFRVIIDLMYYIYNVILQKN